MPRDPRLYITVPLDFLDHPKVVPLSDKAKLTFLDMNIYCRERGIDGDIPIATARAKWAPRHLAALVASHPERPLVVLTGTHYVIRDYAEHQLTAAAIDALREKRAAAGRAGGKAKANAVALAKQTGSKALAESESRDRRQTDDGDTHSPVTVGDARAELTDEDFIAQQAGIVGIRNLARCTTALERVVGPLTAAQTVDLTRAVIELAVEPVRRVEAYVETACVQSPDEVRAQHARLAAGWP